MRAKRSAKSSRRRQFRSPETATESAIRSDLALSDRFERMTSIAATGTTAGNPSVSTTGQLKAERLLAMQKVEGSNPFSRFFANPLHVGGLGSAR